MREIMAQERNYAVNTSQPMRTDKEIEQTENREQEIESRIHAVIEPKPDASTTFKCEFCDKEFYSIKSRGCHIGRCHSDREKPLGSRLKGKKTHCKVCGNLVSKGNILRHEKQCAAKQNLAADRSTTKLAEPKSATSANGSGKPKGIPKLEERSAAITVYELRERLKSSLASVEETITLMERLAK